MAKKADPAAFIRSLSANPLPPIILVGGPERVLVTEAVNTVRERTLTSGLSDFNHDRLRAPVDKKRLIAALNTLPVMTERRLVEVEDAERVDDETIDALADYLKNPVVSSVLLLIGGARLDMGRRLAQRAKKFGAACKMDHPWESEMPAVVRQRAERHGMVFDEDALTALAVTVGTDLGVLEQALKKLALIVERGTVTLAQVAEHVADSRLADSFALAAAVGVGDRALAFQHLGVLERRGGVPMATVGLIAWQLRRILRARSLLDEGEAAGAVARQLRAFGPSQGPLISAARNTRLVCTLVGWRASPTPIWRSNLRAYRRGSSSKGLSSISVRSPIQRCVWEPSVSEPIDAEVIEDVAVTPDDAPTADVDTLSPGTSLALAPRSGAPLLASPSFFDAAAEQLAASTRYGLELAGAVYTSGTRAD